VRCKVLAEMKNPPWPIVLKWPIIVDEIVDEVVKGITPPMSMSDLHIEVMNAISEEKGRRVEIISEFLGTKVPNDYDEWFELLEAVCRHWNIPAFRTEQAKPRGPGASQIWTDQKHCELFADVMRLKKRTRSELGACKFIAQNPKQFGPRYLLRKGSEADAFAKTLHRQFLNAKRKIKSDQLFRAVHFSIDHSAQRPALQYGPEFVDRAINLYAYKRHQLQPNSA
jgi:hypothetical protein